MDVLRPLVSTSHDVKNMQELSCKKFPWERMGVEIKNCLRKRGGERGKKKGGGLGGVRGGGGAREDREARKRVVFVHHLAWTRPPGT